MRWPTRWIWIYRPNPQPGASELGGGAGEECREGSRAEGGYEKWACVWSLKEQGILEEAHELDQLLGREFFFLVSIYHIFLGA